MPMVSKKALERVEARKALLDQRRNPKKGKVKKFLPRAKVWPVVISTETDDETPGRDMPYRIEGVSSLLAVMLALEDFKAHIKPNETIILIKVGEGEWLETKGIGAQD